jgi:hypothetical protein
MTEITYLMAAKALDEGPLEGPIEHRVGLGSHWIDLYPSPAPIDHSGRSGWKKNGRYLPADPGLLASPKGRGRMLRQKTGQMLEQVQRKPEGLRLCLRRYD